MELWVNIIISVIFLVLSINHLKSRQSSFGYLLPGWIIVILLAVYSVPASLLYAIDPNLINATFDRSLQYSSILGCQQCSTVVLLAFYFSELLAVQRKRMYRGKIDYIVWDLDIKNQRYKGLILILFLLSVYLYARRWDSVGGILNVLIIGRADAIYEMEASGGSFARYDIILFLSASFFFPYVLTHRFKKNKVFIILMAGLYASFFILLLAAGTRLPIVSIFFAGFSLLFTFNKEWLRRKKKLIIIGGIVFYLLFNVYSFFRNDYSNLLSNVRSRELSYVEIFFPNETLTSYLSYDAMIQSPEHFYENQFYKLIPSTLRELLNMKPFVPYATRLQDIYQTVSTLTIPLPVDLYFGSKGIYVYMFLLAFFAFFIIDRSFAFLSKFRYGAILMTWLYLLSFYFIRTESVGWFSRGMLLFILGIPLLLVMNSGSRAYIVK